MTGKTRITAGIGHVAATAIGSTVFRDTVEAGLVADWPLHLRQDPPDQLPPVRALVENDVALAPHAGQVHWHNRRAGTRVRG